MTNPDAWIETLRKCEPLSEFDMKKLCEKVFSSLQILHLN